MTTEEMLLQLIEGQKQMTTDFNKRFDKIENDIAEIKDDISEIKEDIEMLTANSNHNGEVLEQMVKDLAPLNMLNVKY